ncbi:YigZ family protein [uncultured Muribaculum sp.]|uniref:IMPACT family protein n=1 Tax=uncultured Muribaculum sp. TaxID=1918613 RepID=UPI0025E1B731|nr:YigZ family protein [uncultured Muribaculum sp.]
MDYLTLAAPSEAKYTEKMSRFLAFAHPAATVDEAKGIIAEYSRRYHDARHVCWAYMLGAKRLDYQSTDNGEPSGTAGKPILGQINSFNLTDVVIVVVRYFGGIKLGTSGLISAYREAAREAIEAGYIVERSEMAELSFTFPYLSMNDVMRLVKDSAVKITGQEFDNSCAMTVSMPADNIPAFSARLNDIDGTSIR